MNKKINIEQIEFALNICYSANLPVQGNFIFGDIEETVETSEISLNWLKENQKKYGLKVSHVIAYPGTQIYIYACEKGLISDKVKFLEDGCPQINISKMSNEEYSVLTRKIADLVSSPLNPLENYNIYDINDQKGFISFTGLCPNCGYKNDWREIHLFQTAFMTCENCGQKFSPPVSDKKLISNIESNLTLLISKYGKIAVWGMHDHIITIFKNSDPLSDPNIYPIDNSSNKQGNNLFSKIVYSPDIINDEKISTVIIAVPWYFGIIQSTIKMHYPQVQRIIDISSLIGDAK